MERTSKVKKSKVVEEMAQEPEEKVFRWKVVGGSPFHGSKKDGHVRIYKPGEVFLATESDVPMAFRDVIVKTEVTSVQEQTRIVPGKVATYTLQECKKEDSENEEEEVLFDVVNYKGKAINEKPLSKEKAESLIAKLSE